MPLQLDELPPEGGALRDIYDEALDEAAWFAEIVDGAFDDAEHTLASLAAGPEHALFGALEVLVVDVEDGSSLQEVMDAPAGPYHFQVAVLAKLALGAHDVVLEATRHAEPPLRAAAIRACALVGDATVLARARRELQGGRGPESAPWLDVLAAYQAPLDAPARWLSHDDPAILTAALRIAAVSDPHSLIHWLDGMLEYPHEAVQDQALLAALYGHSSKAWNICERVALSERAANALAIELYGALGGASACTRLEPLLASPPHAPHVLFTLGAAGLATSVPLLLQAMEGAGRNARLAFEAFSTLSGLDVLDPRFARPSTDVDDLDDLDETPIEEDLVHEAVDDVALPNVEAVARWWSEHASSVPAHVRVLAGRPFELASVRQFLLDAPLRRRALIAHVLKVQARGRIALDVRARASHQIAQLAALKPIPLQNPYGAW